MGNAVVHFDVMGSNPEVLQTFFGELFGWAITPIPEMNYALVDTQGGRGINGGIGASQEGPGFVTFYVASDDLQAALDKAESLGATTIMPVTVIPDTVSLAMFTDPAGNKVGLVGTAPGQEGQQAQGPSEGDGTPVTWFEVMGTDPKALVAFYTELFGWEATKFDTPPAFEYYTIETGASGINGGIGSANDMTYVTVYAEPKDLQACIGRAEALGAKVLMPPVTMPDGATIAMIADPEGNMVGLVRSPQR